MRMRERGGRRLSGWAVEGGSGRVVIEGGESRAECVFTLFGASAVTQSAAFTRVRVPLCDFFSFLVGEVRSESHALDTGWWMSPRATLRLRVDRKEDVALNLPLRSSRPLPSPSPPLFALKSEQHAHDFQKMDYSTRSRSERLKKTLRKKKNSPKKPNRGFSLTQAHTTPKCCGHSGLGRGGVGEFARVNPRELTHLNACEGCVGISEKKLLNSGTRSSWKPPARDCSR